MHLVVIGNGVAGITAALCVRDKQPDWKITVVSGESHFHYSRPALMYIFMGHMRFQETKPFEDSFWDRKRIERVRAWATRIDTSAKRVELHGAPGLPYDRLLIATGSRSNLFGWPGQELEGVQGLWGLHDLHRLYENVRRTRQAVIVGGGLIGIELAEMLHSRGIPVTFLVREQSYWDNVLPKQESGLLNEIIRQAAMGLRLETELTRIEDDGQGRCAAVVTSEGDRIECELVGLTAGVSPNIDLVRDSEVETGRGVLVDRSFHTSVPDVFAAGDCAEIRSEDGDRNLIQQVWYTGKMQAEVAADAILGEPRPYDPGIWFNSAKFLDLEYQTYGQVNMRVEGERNLYWEHPDRRHALRIVHVDGATIGINLMGLRFRHEVCERWIRERRPVNDVVDRLGEAHFDPELYRRHDEEIRRSLREQISGSQRT